MADSIPVPHQDWIEVENQLVARFRVSAGASFFHDFEVEASADLGLSDPWSPDRAVYLGLEEGPGPFSFRYYRFHLPAQTAPRAFFRIRYKGLTSHPND